MLIPCIDLQGGQAVQLVHGRRRELAVANVIGLLTKFRRHRWLHVIDLDAALGKGENRALLRELCICAKRDHGMQVRVGGGIRTVRRAEQFIQLGAAQIIVGSAAFKYGRPNLTFLKKLRARIPKKRILIALDAARGKIVVHGWRTSLRLSPREVMPHLEPFCSGFLCTDVDREGTMRGANLRWFRHLRSATRLPIVAAGGISSRREIRALEKLGLDAAVGMALYKNRLRQFPCRPAALFAARRLQYDTCDAHPAPHFLPLPSRHEHRGGPSPAGTASLRAQTHRHQRLGRH